MMDKNKLTKLNHNGNDDSGKNIALWVVLVNLNGITVVDLRLIDCPVKAVRKRLISCGVEGNQIPNASGELE